MPISSCARGDVVIACRGPGPGGRGPGAGPRLHTVQDFLIAGKPWHGMWLIDHSAVRRRVWEGCVLRSAEAYCLTVRFTLWTNKGNAIMSSTETATFYLKISTGGAWGETFS